MQVVRVRPDSPAIAKGVPPLSTVVEVNGEPTTGMDVKQVQAFVSLCADPSCRKKVLWERSKMAFASA